MATSPDDRCHRDSDGKYHRKRWRRAYILPEKFMRHKSIGLLSLMISSIIFLL